MAEYDQLTRDLAWKAGDDTVAVIKRTMALHDAIASKKMIALLAAGQALAIPAALVSHSLPMATPEQVVDALWSQLRPIVLSSIKGVAHAL